jgi:hypothetical protein
MLAPGCEWAQIQHAQVAEGALWFSFVPGYNVTGALQRAVTHSWQPELCDLLGFHHRLQDLTMGISITKPNLETGIQAAVEPSSMTWMEVLVREKIGSFKCIVKNTIL